MFDEVTELPTGWAITTLSNVVEVLDNRRIPLNATEREKRKGVYPYYGANGQVDSIDDYLFDGNYVLIAEDGGYFDDPTRGVAYRVTGKFWVNNHAHIVSPLGSMSTQFFVYALNKINWMQYVSGTTRLKLTQGSLLKVPLLLPPLNEQHRIVAKIEALKARSQQVKEALEAIPPLLDQFRQSVLAAAFRGDLTADWREDNHDVERASELLNKIQSEKPEIKQSKINYDIPALFNLPNTWKWTKLSSICSSITDGDHQPPPKVEKGIPFLVISNISKGKLDFSETRYVPEDYYQSIHKTRKPCKGDILYTVVGATYGIPVLVDSEEKFCFQRHIALLRTSHLISNQWLFYILKSNLVYRQATEVTTGTAQPTVPLSGLRQIKVPLPPLTEQLEIARRVETLFKIADCVKQQHKQAKAYLDQLDQSILAKAFRGELVPQDPNDEPASVLLERIRTERTNREAEAKAARKSTGKTTVRRTRKAKQQDSESVQLGLPGLE